MKFEFATATRIIFGEGVLREIGALAAPLGRRAFVVGGSSRQRLTPLLTLLAAQGIETVVFSVPGEPTIDLVLEGVQQAHAANCDLVIGMGGGSALDAGKAIAALLTNPGDPLDYLEVIGRGQPLLTPSAPYIAIPTTAGTGAEVTRNAVLAAPTQQVKVSLRSPFMLPRIALIDPVLTIDLPPAITASTGLDALTQCLEPYVSNQANPLTDALCREGMQRAARSLRRTFEDGGDTTARADMAIASLCGGLALANAKLGAVHGFAAPLGGMFPAPHGVICARLLPLVMAANVRALQERSPTSPMLARYAEVAQILTGDAAAEANAGVRWVQALCAALAIPPLANFGVTEADMSAVVAKAQKASSMQGNSLVLTSEELTQILHQAL
ncbi:MAG: iron-containing alcohol dehydrogenase [Chloroflexi bacterium]|nr:iron-containing alcohol dehydrogenase [Chloroflexota bacterium]